MSYLSDAASLIWPGGMCWQHTLAAQGMKAREEQEEVPEATAHNAGIRLRRLLASKPSEKRRKSTRR